jgi:undecaprenyl-diphosphatase
MHGACVSTAAAAGRRSGTYSPRSAGSATESSGTRALDRYSFPSGHTLHAVSFTILAVHSFPELAWLLVPFAALIAASRVVLGLHYPSDVAAGALIGAALATLSMVLVPLVG